MALLRHFVCCLSFQPDYYSCFVSFRRPTALFHKLSVQYGIRSLFMGSVPCSWDPFLVHGICSLFIGSVSCLWDPFFVHGICSLFMVSVPCLWDPFLVYGICSLFMESPFPILKRFSRVYTAVSLVLTNTYRE